MTYRDATTAVPVLVASMGAFVVGADASTGKVLWTHRIDRGLSTCRLAFHRERVIAACQNQIWCIEQTSGAVSWKKESPVSVEALIVDLDRIFVAYGGEVACFDGDGALLWHEVLRGVIGSAIALAISGQVVQADETVNR